MVRHPALRMRRRQLALLVGTCAALALLAGSKVRGADQPPATAAPIFKQYCYTCHGNGVATAGVSLERLTSGASVADTYQIWERVIQALDQKRMPPKGLPQPSDEQREHAVAWVHSQLDGYVKAHAGDPGRVTVRRLTSGEYNYTIHDLTGLDLDLGIDASNDSVGGEGFTNFGDVQFMQGANLERYLEAAKAVADHAVVGAGPLQFYIDPGKSGFEMSAIHRIKDIDTAYGFRTVSGEGGFSFGLERYTKALFAAWEYQHRAALGQPNATFASFAGPEGITARFAQHIFTVMNRRDLAYPSYEMAARFHKLPAPTADLKTSVAAARAACEELQKYITNWPGWLFARGDAAYGGAGDESPLIISEKSLKVEGTHHFLFNRGGRGAPPGRGAAGGRGTPAAPSVGRIYLFASPVNPSAKGKPVVIWRNATVSFRQGFGRGGATTAAAGNADGAEDPNAPPKPPAAQPAAVATAGAGANPPPGGRGRGPAAPRVALRTVVTEECAKKLNFGTSPDGAAIGPNDFASDLASTAIEVTLPAGMTAFDFQGDAEVGADRDQVFRIIITDREDGGSRGIPIRAILGDPKSSGYQAFKAGVLQLADILPPNSNSEPTPADKDPPPEPFDPTYNTPEHDAFDNDVKYVRDDHFIYRNILDDATRAKVDQAWDDVYTSFEYHDHYLKLIAEHYGVDLKGKHIGELSKSDFDAMSPDPRNYALGLRATYDAAHAAEMAARPRHVEDCLQFASRAWRRPLTEKEKLTLRTFYQKVLAEDSDHTRAIKALIARILVAPEFLYKLEQAPGTSAALVRPVAATVGASVKPLSGWEIASRLSYFLWSSIPDEELRRAAAAGELNDPQQLRKQTERMLADPKARRLATEFFGQWLGFYQFDRFKGVDTSRFPEFTQEVKSSMYDEAVSFFEYTIRSDRPVSEFLTADYTFLNSPLAKYYGISKEIKSKEAVEKVDGVNAFHRGGLLRLGAILTATSAPLRTSPVRRGDWVLRRILGTAVPPPPADAGSIPADDKLFGGLSVRERLQVHKRNATCATCHTRIDPLGFPLEHYDSTGRWRDQYSDGKSIDDYGTLSDNTQITGVTGLLDYLHTSQADQVQRTLAHKLVGYALGRTLLLSDQPLVDSLVSAGSQAGFSQIVGQIVTSKQFRNHAGQDDNPAATAERRASAKPLNVPQGQNGSAAIPSRGVPAQDLSRSNDSNQVGRR
jgi:mono/diheme cytochrome c family protein